MNLKNSEKLIFFLLLFILTFPAFAQKKDIISYFPSWKWKDRNQLVNPQSVPYGKITIINYAFFIPLENGDIIGMDPEADSHLLKSKIDSVTGEIIPNSTLVDIAHQHNVKVMISLGGWEDSGNFPDIADDPVKRANFANWCNQYIRTYKFDGIDVDWEYPGYVPHNGSPRDKENFITLLQTIRDSLDVLGKKDNKHYMLSAALPASKTHTANIDMAAVTKILDFMNIMTYDFFGPWESISNHNAPLYAPDRGDSSNNFDSTFRLYHETYNVPAHKINLGVAFYGHVYANCTKLHTAHTQGKENLFSEIGGADFYNIHKNMKLFTEYWDSAAQVPYLVNEAEKLFVSYDNESSVKLKAEYVMDKNARGLIIWQMMGDYLDDGSTPLLNSIDNVFNAQ